MKDKKNKKEEIKEEVNNDTIDDSIKNDDKLLEEIEKLKAEVLVWKEKTYRTAADTDNLRKSYERDHENLLKYRAMGFVERLLPVLDSFHLSLMVKPKDPAIANYVKGFEMIYRQMLTALEQEGVKEIAPGIGDDFDPENMQAIDVKDGDEDNKIVQVYSNGYIFKDRLVRPAMVVVSKIPTTTNTEDVNKDSDEPKLN